MYQERFRYVYALLALVATAGVSAALIGLALSVGDPKVRTKEVPAALLTPTSSVADVNDRFDRMPAQEVDGATVGLEGGTCDVRYLKDGLLLVCHG